MAAGLSRKQRNQRVYNRLLILQSKLSRVGVTSFYHRYQLTAETTGLEASDNGFNVQYRWLGASNGECAGVARVTVFYNGATETYGWLEHDGDYNKGLARVVELFSRLAPDQRPTVRF